MPQHTFARTGPPTRTAPPTGCDASDDVGAWGDVDATEAASARLLRHIADDRSDERERHQARTRVIELNLPFAHRLARRFAHRGQPLDDLLQVAAMALVKAVDGFDVDRGKPFFGYAAPTIVGEIKRYFRDKGWDMRVPRRLQELHLSLTSTRADLTQRLQRAPTTAELAAALGLSEQETRDGLAAATVYDLDSLNRRTGADDDSCQQQDLLGTDDPGLDAVSDRVTLHTLIRRLPTRERHVLTCYFFGNLTQEQIATQTGMSQMNISRLLSRCLAHLRRQMDGSGTDIPAARDDSRLTVSTYPATPGTLVVAVRGDLNDTGTDRLRDALIAAATRHRPRRIIADLRHARSARPAAVRALIDGYRACGHVSATLAVVNVPAGLFAALCRFGVHRLFACSPITPVPPATAPPTPATTPRHRPSTTGRNLRVSAPVPSGSTRPRTAVPARCPTTSADRLRRGVRNVADARSAPPCGAAAACRPPAFARRLDGAHFRPTATSRRTGPSMVVLPLWRSTAGGQPTVSRTPPRRSGCAARGP